MNATPRAHFEELDWLDYAQGEADRSLAGEMQHHLSGCADCRLRLDSMRQLAAALPFAQSLVETESDRPDAGGNTIDFDSIARRARERADSIAPDREETRAEIVEAFSIPGREAFAWTPSSYETARALTRELLRSDVSLAGRIARSALSALEKAPGREALRSDGLEGVLRTVAAYVLFSEGESERALEELERARPILETLSRVPEDDLAFWAYVSALTLRDLGRAEAALEALDMAERLQGLLEDFPRQARCRIIRAVIFADLGRRQDAIRIYEGLLSRGGADLEDGRLLGTIHLNLGSDLIHVNRLAEAKREYAKAAEIIRRTGDLRKLVSIRAGLVEVARLEERYQDVYDIGIQLRADYRSQNLGWDEIRIELRIAEALLHLGREAEAREACGKILPRIHELGLSAEAARAVEYLTRAELSLASLEKVSRFLDRHRKDDTQRWSAA